MKNLFFARLLPALCLFFPLAVGADSPGQSLQNEDRAPDSAGRVKRLKIKSLSDLQQLTPYESVSVIQKRYLPKTFRGELNLSLSGVINHTFFYVGGLSAKAGFFIREDHGFGLEGFAFLPAVNKLVTNEMIGPPNHILPFTAVLSQFYAGAYYKWSPVFGKFAVLNKKIIYFDMYMTFGAGASKVIRGLTEKTERALEGAARLPRLEKDLFPSMSLSLGQIFSLSQDWAFNWELKWFYTIIQFQNQSAPYTPLDINLSLGLSYYFPGAGYR